MNDNFVFWNGSGVIVPSAMYEFLEGKGFGKYFPPEAKRKSTEPVIVHVTGKIVSEVNVSFIIGVVHDYILECHEHSGECSPVLDSLHKSTGLFGQKNLMMLPTLDLKFISDTREAGYAFFRNGVVEITRDEVILRDYDCFDGYVWENNIVKMNFGPLHADKTERFDFSEFLRDLSFVADPGHAVSRLHSLRSAIGYLLHRYKDGTTTKAVILMDVFVNGSPNGGSGKSLLLKSVGQIRKAATIDGKKYDQREWFALSSVGLDSELLVFDDVKRNFDFEEIFPLVTEGLLQRRKHKDHIFIPHKHSPKVSITTNYAINGESSSFKRRMFEFEVSPYYSADRTPRDKYGRNFFDDWDEADFNFFYNIMFHCLQVYLSAGLVESEPININRTKLTNSTNEDFIEWADERIPVNQQQDKKAMFESFTTMFPEHRFLKQRTFTDWLRCWGKYMNLNVIESHSGDIRNITFAGR